MASNNSGVWNEAGASFDFSIDPAYYQTTWFQASCVAAFLALLWGLYGTGSIRSRSEFNVRLEERVNERTRIARDLHDTLLQSFQGLMLRFQAVGDMLPDAPRAKEHSKEPSTGRIRRSAEGRDALTTFVPPRWQPTTWRAMTALMTSLGEELAAGNGRPNVPRVGGGRATGPASDSAGRGLPRLLARRCEMLSATRRRGHIEAEITVWRSLFRLRIRDDGKGIDPKSWRRADAPATTVCLECASAPNGSARSWTCGAESEPARRSS